MIGLDQPHHLVLASAGTGKTYRLTVEYLDRLLNGARPETLLATTFTRKAAGEILERVLLRLAEATLDRGAAEVLGAELGSQPHGPLDRETFGQLLLLLADRMHRLSISTLDAFFNRILSSFRLELGLPGNPTLLVPDDPRVERLRSAALESVLEELAADDFEQLLQLLNQLHENNARRSVAWELDRIFAGLYEVFRQAPEAALWNQLEQRAMLDSEEIDRHLESLHLVLVEEPLKASVEKALRLELAMLERGNWRGVLDKGIGKKLAEDPGDPFYRGIRVPDVVVEAYLPLLVHAEAVLLNRLADRAEAMWALLADYTDQFDFLRAQQQFVLFSDLAFRLSHELPALDADRLIEVYYRLDGKVEHLLLDEFQDTSLEQWQVLSPFVDEILATGDRTRTLFCVGDPKQAIYGWRGGCSELFEVVAQQLGARDMHAETLALNYRSSQVVLDAVNKVFEAAPLFPKFNLPGDDSLREVVERWCGNYEPHKAFHDQRSGSVRLVCSRSIEPELEDTPERGDGEGGSEGVDRPDLYLETVVENVLDIARAAPDCSVGVLVRTNRMVGYVLDALRRSGLDASGEGGSPVVDDPLVTQLLSALVLADHPGDSVALYHLAGSALGESLLGPVAGQAVASWQAASAARRVRYRLSDVGLAALVAEFAAVLAPWADARSAARLAQLLELAETFEAGSAGRAMDFVNYARSATVEDPTPASIRVMTIHKSKGLEFDAVVLAELESSRARGSDLTVWLERPRPTEPPSAIFRAARKSLRRLDDRLVAAHRQEVERRLWDDLSTLYVAMTRARRALRIVVKSKKKVKKRTERFVDSFADLLVFALSGNPTPEEQDALLFESGSPDWAEDFQPDEALDTVAGTSDTEMPGAPRDALESVDQPLQSEQPGDREPARKGAAPGTAKRLRGRGVPVVLPSSLSDQDLTVDVSELLRVEPTESLLRGAVVHEWLAQIEWLDLSKKGKGLPSRKRLFSRARSVAPRAKEEWIERWWLEFQEMLQLPEVTRALTRPQPGRRGERAQVWVERDFAMLNGQEMHRGRFDRVVVFQRKGRFVGAELFEWKTSSLVAPDGAGAGVAREAALQQLAVYRESLASILGLLVPNVLASVVLLGSGERIDL